MINDQFERYCISFVLLKRNVRNFPKINVNIILATFLVVKETNHDHKQVKFKAYLLNTSPQFTHGILPTELQYLLGHKFLLTPMGVLAPGSARARPSARPTST